MCTQNWELSEVDLPLRRCVLAGVAYDIARDAGDVVNLALATIHDSSS